MFNLHTQQALVNHPGLSGRRLLFEVLRLMLSAQVYDVTDATRSAIANAQPTSVDSVRQQPTLVCFSLDMAAQSAALKRFLSQNLYRHAQVVEKMQHAQSVVRELFAAYLADPSCLPQTISGQLGADLQNTQQVKPERRVADYIAGMTDRFATKEHERLGLRHNFQG